MFETFAELEIKRTLQPVASVFKERISGLIAFTVPLHFVIRPFGFAGRICLDASPADFSDLDQKGRYLCPPRHQECMCFLESDSESDGCASKIRLHQLAHFTANGWAHQVKKRFFANC